MMNSRMMNLSMIKRSLYRIVALVFVLSVVVACASRSQKQPLTLRDIDVSNKSVTGEDSYVKSKSKEEIKKAYYDYISSAASKDKMRVQAVNRIAQLELNLEKSLSDNSEPGLEDDTDEQLYVSTVKSTIDLLNQALSDFPDAPGNDQTLYQLAKAYDQLGNYEGSIGALIRLAEKYQDSPYFVEAQFRIAEDAFMNGFYLRAEVGYTSVINSAESRKFYEKALFKRGWSRFKQELYFEALDDYYAALDYHKFPAEQKMSGSEKEQYNEYFRAVGLAFSYIGGTEAINDYFVGSDDSEYVYKTFSIVSSLLLKQERYSDAVDIYQSYLKSWPDSPNAVTAHLKIVDIWKSAKFFKRYVDAFETFYLRFYPGSPEWKKSKDAEEIHKEAIKIIRENAVLLAGYFHNEYKKKGKTDDLNKAMSWYKRYLKDYKDYARQDKVFQLYAELLLKTKDKSGAFALYEQAAFDGDLILDKESAYASIVLANELSASGKQGYLDKQIRYALLFSQLYPQDKRSQNLVKNGVEQAFKTKRYQQAIDLANALPDKTSRQVAFDISLLKAQAYFDLEQFEDSEIVYHDLLASKTLSNKHRQNLFNKLGLAIYKQAEALKANDPKAAADQFVRVEKEAPESELAATAMYDGIALYLQAEQWPEAVHYLKQFKELYPNHKYIADVTKKLSFAYLSSNKNLEAAKEFEALAKGSGSDEEKKAALWQAAKLYESKGDLEASVRAYRDYAHNHKRPYPQNMEAMYKLTDLYQKQKVENKREFWLLKMAASDRKASSSAKTDRTRFLASFASFELAKKRMATYKRIKLVNPIKENLRKKKKALQESVKFYGQASAYGQRDFITEAAFQIGYIYKDFSVSLLESERPKGLTPDQEEQYEILLEDQAFPFEDKAIEFYEANVIRIKNGIYDDWVKQSLGELAELFPARYGRKGKLEKVIE